MNKKYMSFQSGLSDLSIDYLQGCSFEALEFECRRLSLDWAVLPDTVAEYQRRLVMSKAIAANSALLHIGRTNQEGDTCD